MTKRRFVVVEHSGEKHSLKRWLREHPDCIPSGLNPDRDNSWSLRDGLKKHGWTVTDARDEVQLFVPDDPTHARITGDLPCGPAVIPQKLSEDSFADLLVSAITPSLHPHKVGRKRSLLYELSFDQHGVVAMGVDPDTGEPIRGHGRGFEQDILVFDETAAGHTSVVPLIVAEVKFGSVTTHDVIVYSEKADRIRRVYPYLRYGFVLGGLSHIPGRVLRLGQRFDFIATLSAELGPAELNWFCQLMRDEVEASLTLTALLFGRRKSKLLQKHLTAK